MTNINVFIDAIEASAKALKELSAEKAQYESWFLEKADELNKVKRELEMTKAKLAEYERNDSKVSGTEEYYNG